MKKPTVSELNFALWMLIGEVSHSIILVRQRELNQYHIPVRQWDVLRIIHRLGSDATISEVSTRLKRQFHSVSRQVAKMEKDGLIKRIRKTPKSSLLSLELTEKALNLIKIGKESKSIDEIFSFLSNEERQIVESILTQISTRVKEYYLRKLI